MGPDQNSTCRICKDKQMLWRRYSCPWDSCRHGLAWTGYLLCQQSSWVSWYDLPCCWFPWRHLQVPDLNCSSTIRSVMEWKQFQSLLITVRLFEYLATPFSSNDAAPVLGPIIVDKSVPFNKGFSAPPTREGSALAFSLLNVLHSDPTSITLENNRHKYWW